MHTLSLLSALPGQQCRANNVDKLCALAWISLLHLKATNAQNLQQTEQQIKAAAPQAQVHSCWMDLSSEQQADDVIGQALKVGWRPCHACLWLRTGASARCPLCLPACAASS